MGESFQQNGGNDLSKFQQNGGAIPTKWGKWILF